MSCDNLCTAAKCQELEERIGRLEQIVDLLEASFEAHTNQPIPIAHDYAPPEPEKPEEPEVTVSLAVAGNTLKVFVKVGQKSGDETIELPKYEPEVGVSLAVAGNDLEVFVEVGEKNDSETIALPKYDPDVNLDVFELGQNSFGVSLQIGEKHAQDNFTVTLPEIEFPEIPKSNLVGTANIEGEILTISIADGESQTVFSTALPEIEFPEIPKSNLVGTANIEGEILTISIADGESQTVFSTALPKIEFPEIPKSNLVGTANIEGETLTISIADGESQTVFSTALPEIEFPKYEPILDLNLDINPLNFLTATIKLDNQEASDSVLLPEFNIDDLIDLIDDLKKELKELVKEVLIELLDDLIEEVFKLIKDLLLNDNEYQRGNLSIDSTYENDYLNLTITDGFSSDSTSVYIPMCDLDNLERLITEIHDYTVIDVTGETINDFKCLDPTNSNIKLKQNIPYTGKGITGLHELIKITNANLLPIFKNSCEPSILASPDWWQVRLGALRPQIVCTFRRGVTRTYHSTTIPHPQNVDKPTDELIPEYQKGNWQGMIILTDNSKFIINCNSSSEAERICNIAASLIDSFYLPNPLKIWLTERKGEPVATDLMKPTTIMYYPTGQKSANPEWYFAIPK